MITMAIFEPIYFVQGTPLMILLQFCLAQQLHAQGIFFHFSNEIVETQRSYIICPRLQN